MQEYMFQICSPSSYVSKSKGVFIEEYITNRGINATVRERINEEGFFKLNFREKWRKTFELTKEVRKEIYSGLSQKLENLQKWHNVEILDMGDFEDIKVKASNSREAREKMRDVLLDVENFLGRYHVYDRINYYDIKEDILVVRRPPRDFF